MKAVVLFSGGIDSTVTAWKLKKEGYEIYPLTFNTYRRNIKEVEAVIQIASKASHHSLITIDVSFMKEVVDYPEVLKNDMQQLPSILIPYRNLIFYSIAANIASQVCAGFVAGGHTVEDEVRIPDANRNFFIKLEKLFTTSMPQLHIKILTPLIGFRKTDVTKLGIELGAPLNLTWSCWNIFDKHCGRCPGCVARREAFRSVGMRDETEYLEA